MNQGARAASWFSRAYHLWALPVDTIKRAFQRSSTAQTVLLGVSVVATAMVSEHRVLGCSGSAGSC